MSDAALTNQEVASNIHRALQPLEIVPIDAELPDESSVAGIRRNRRSRFEDSVGVVTLLDIDGVLVWEDGAVSSSTSTVRKRRAGTAADGTVVTQLKFSKELGFNQIAEKLRKLDEMLTPNGPAQLLEYDRTNWASTRSATPIQHGHILLFIHGTFSETGRIVTQLKSEPAGKEFLAKAQAGYNQVLGYDHFTLSRTPVVNAVELARQFAESDAELDIVCHSRGGLVARWFCEILDKNRSRKRRVVFVGCPLRGTSLADPQSLRNGLNLLTNAGKLLGNTVQLVPLLAAAGGLVQIISSVGGFTAKTPLVDAGVGLIPGLAAMSRIQNNAELEALNFGPPQARVNYFAITSNFRSEAPGWRFWKYFTKSNLADVAADYLVFNQENDLVVDTESMTHHAFGANPNFTNDKIFRCFEGDKVHHTNYFEHAETGNFLVERFGL